MRRGPLLLRAAPALLAIALFWQPAQSAGQPIDDAFSLLREETATAPTKRPLPLAETPSSVTVITAAEIQAMGYRTLGEALRWVRGVYVTYDRNYTYVGVRGLQRPGDYSNKVLLSLDGHTLNGNVYGDAAFGPELGLDLEEVERIEIVRGPGSTLYGSFAALAVVNVVTRRPRSEAGVTADMSAGGNAEYRGHAGVASARPGWPEWHASVSWLAARGADLYFPEFYDPPSGSGVALGRDGERAWSFFGSANWGVARLALKFNDREKVIPTASFGTYFATDQNRTWDGHDFAELTVDRRATNSLQLTVRAYWDGARYRGRYIYDYDPGAPLVESLDWGDGDLLGTEVRANWAVARSHTLTLGVEAQRTARARIENVDVAPYFLYYDINPRSSLLALYVQDEMRLAPRLAATAGIRLDDHSRYPAVVSPRADLVWTLAASTRLKLLGGSAFRAPSPYESSYLLAYLNVPPPRLNPERVVTLEGTIEHAAGPFTSSLTAYSNSVRDLIDLAGVDESGNEFYCNRARARARGLEGEVRAVPSAATRLRLALAWQRSEDVDTGAELTNSPAWNSHLLVIHSPAEGPYSIGAGVRFLSPRLTLAGRRTAPALVCDARVARRLGRVVRLGLETRNLFDARYGDPGSSEHPEDQIEQDHRAFYVTLSYLSGEGP